METVHITYFGDASARFDRDYYRNHHLTLVMESWGQYGLQGLSVFYPEDGDKGVVAICVCNFRDKDSITASFQSKEADDVMEDVKHFTDISPKQSKAVPL